MDDKISKVPLLGTGALAFCHQHYDLGQYPPDTTELDSILVKETRPCKKYSFVPHHYSRWHLLPF